jgi:hypothetical protein
LLSQDDKRRTELRYISHSSKSGCNLSVNVSNWFWMEKHYKTKVNTEYNH